MITCVDLDDEDAFDARQLFAELQARAEAAGHTLTRTAASGFVLRAGSVSKHSADLHTIAALLAPLKGKQ